MDRQFVTKRAIHEITRTNTNRTGKAFLVSHSIRAWWTVNATSDYNRSAQRIFNLKNLGESVDFDSFDWTTAESTYDTRPVLVRVINLPKSFPKEKYPQRINIFWKMSQTHHDGLPTASEFAKLETFEDRLVEAVQRDKHSLLVGALTCNGEKEFIFHTGDATGFIDRLTRMPQETERYPITIQKYDDPNWSYLERMTPC